MYYNHILFAVVLTVLIFLAIAALASFGRSNGNWKVFKRDFFDNDPDADEVTEKQKAEMTAKELEEWGDRVGEKIKKNKESKKVN